MIIVSLCKFFFFLSERTQINDSLDLEV